MCSDGFLGYTKRLVDDLYDPERILGSQEYVRSHAIKRRL
jgi:hypothetical protein